MPLDFRKLSVLVVEDNQHMRQLIVQVLRAMGVVDVFQADGGQRALVMVRQNKPDVIVTDWLMDPMDGLELTRRIRSDPDSPARLAPIILMTGYSAHARVTQARDIGVTEFLVKPFTAEALAKRIAHVINMPRDFIAAPLYAGPDRRRKRGDVYGGPKRRNQEKQA
jgi:two-component system, chemotaxis family, chemotaxis protein CheY